MVMDDKQLCAFPATGNGKTFLSERGCKNFRQTCELAWASGCYDMQVHNLGNHSLCVTTAGSETRPRYYHCDEIVYRHETEGFATIRMLPGNKKISKNVFACSSRNIACNKFSFSGAAQRPKYLDSTISIFLPPNIAYYFSFCKGYRRTHCLTLRLNFAWKYPDI